MQSVEESLGKHHAASPRAGSEDAHIHLTLHSHLGQRLRMLTSTQQIPGCFPPSAESHGPALLNSSTKKQSTRKERRGSPTNSIQIFLPPCAALLRLSCGSEMQSFRREWSIWLPHFMLNQEQPEEQNGKDLPRRLPASLCLGSPALGPLSSRILL